MVQLAWWDIALVAFASFLAVTWLVRLMRHQKEAVIEELREQAARARQSNPPSDAA